MDLKDLLKRGDLVGLSPMDGITDEPFRLTQCAIARPDLLFTEFVSAEGLAHNAVKLYDHLLYTSTQRPIIGQLFGKDPDSFYTAAVILCHLGFDGIDLNFGCPAKTVTQHGSGAALIDQSQLALKIINSVKKAIADFKNQKVTLSDLKLKQKILNTIERNLKYSDYSEGIVPTLSFKTRLGTQTDTSATWIPFLLSQQPDFLTLHGRTLSQGYSGLADWKAIFQAAKLARKAGIPFFGNGDIQSLAQARESIRKFNLTGVLIGRAAMGNPWVFSKEIPEFKDKFKAMKLHADFFEKFFRLAVLIPFAAISFSMSPVILMLKHFAAKLSL